MFQQAGQARAEAEAPLAARMRPRTFDEFVGQEHLLGEGRALRRLIEADQVPSMVLWGPPGSGKTTLALLIARLTKAHFARVSAVTSGVQDLRRIIEEAKERRAMTDQRTILFVDEIHRFNKAQQDVALPHVEDGTVTFIGATTENPSFEVISPLLSRSRVFTLNALTDDQVRDIVERALADEERGLGKLHARVEPDAMKAILLAANGDARIALNAVELASAVAKPDPSAEGRRVDLATAQDVLQRKALMYDRAGEQHYDTISAYIKSVRGSDPDAALYWLGRMLEAGEDPMFIVRRIILLASEDIGMADPQALSVAVAAQQAVHFIGMPEGFLPLAEATVYLATAPKSNSAYTAYLRALEDVRQTRDDPVPLHLRNAPTALMRDLGYHRGYKYAHEYAEHYVEQQHLPDNLKGRRYYEPGALGYEAKVKEWMERLRKHGGESTRQ
ncbi:MAG: replication-associated recombination protein A [Dehalococcoidia bacterium]|nr:replication-associated recombination protein A [Dehalococcoidia bacterium]